MSQMKDFLRRLGQSQKKLLEYWKKTPTTKIILVNTGIYCMWKFRVIPQEFMVKHFSCERFNLQSGRIHTLLTYAFSHNGIFSLLLDMLMLGLMGRVIQGTVGPKYIYWLYGLGSLFGGLSSTAFQPPSPYIQPQIGPEGAVAAYLTFITLMNPHQTFMLFFFPMKAWVLILLLGSYSLIFDPHKRSFAGITAGLTVFNMRKLNFI